MKYCHGFLTEAGCKCGSECKYKHLTRAEVDKLPKDPKPGGKGGKGDNRAAAPAVMCASTPLSRPAPSAARARREIHYGDEEYIEVPMQPDGELNPVTVHERDGSRLGDFTCIMHPQGVLTPEYTDMALLQYAQARHSALDLAEGQGLLGPDLVTHCDSGDLSEWEGVPQTHSHG